MTPAEKLLEETARAICKCARGYECSASQFVPYKGEPTGPVSCGCGYWGEHANKARAALKVAREHVTKTLYVALKKYKDGGYRDEGIGAGLLHGELSAVLLDVERSFLPPRSDDRSL